MSQHATIEPTREQAFAEAKPAVAPMVTAAPPNAAAVTPDATKAGAKRDVDWAKPWSDEVEGVPTGSKARPDDDHHVVSTETTEKKNGYSSDKKKYQSATAATHTVDRTSTTTTREGTPPTSRPKRRAAARTGRIRKPASRTRGRRRSGSAKGTTP